MFQFQIKVETKPYKADEFVHSVLTYIPKILKQKACLGYRICQDAEKKDTFYIVGEWQTRQNMENHFQNNKFKVLIGAAKVLGTSFSMHIAEVLETGDLELAKENLVSK